jgi:hypothetical protein
MWIFILSSFIFLSIKMPVSARGDARLAGRAAELKLLFGKVVFGNGGRAEEQEFFRKFPESFSEFSNIYGYPNDTAGPLYEVSSDHLKLFFRSGGKYFSDTVFLQKGFSIAFDGYWDADGVGWYQQALRDIVYRDLPLSVAILRGHSRKEIWSFWFFFFDGPHPSATMDERLMRLQDTAPEMFGIISTAHKAVLESWKDE